MTDRPPNFDDMVRDLTSDHQHREPYIGEAGHEDPKTGAFVVTSTWTAQHATKTPALVLQLLGASPTGSGELTGAHPQSRPAARIESLDTIMLIDDEASRWIRRLGQDDPGDTIDPKTGRLIRGSGTIACLRLLGGLRHQARHCRKAKGTQDNAGRWCCPRHELERDVRHWWHQARIITGWDTPAFKPHNSCPVCEIHDSLRIKADAAMCVECRSVWEGADQLGVLARHIREENADTSEPDQATA